MTSLGFTGFAGVHLEAQEWGSGEDPLVLLLHDAGQARDVWDGAATALAAAGRHVIAVDLRGHGTSEWPADGRYDFAALVADLRMLLAQLPMRPVVVAAGLSAALAVAALAEDGTQLAAGLALVDAPASAGHPACDPRFTAAAAQPGHRPDLLADAARISLPSLVLGKSTPAELADAIKDSETLTIDTGSDAADSFNAALLDFLERRAPRAAPVYREGSDPRTLRDALGCFATGITVITSLDPEGNPVGMTANSFTSVSLEPPLLLVCVARTASAANILETAPNFTVNILQIGQQATSNRFARRDEDRFAATAWEPGVSGVPMLSGTMASFECAREAVHGAGDHFILLGRVIEARFEPRRDPLLYFRGKYRRLHFA